MTQSCELSLQVLSPSVRQHSLCDSNYTIARLHLLMLAHWLKLWQQ